MAHIPLSSIDVHGKLNGKRLLAFGIITMLTLTLFAAVAVRQARAITYGGPWWFLPATWHYEAGVGSNRTTIMCTYPVDTVVPLPTVINTTGQVSFDLVITAPDESGNASITVPQASISIDRFHIKTITYIFTFYLWCHIYATGDGSGTLDTVGGNLKVDVFTTVVGDGNGGYTVENEITSNVTGPSRPGDSLIYMPLEINLYSGTSMTDPTPTGDIDITEPMLLYVTTGYTQTTIDDQAGHPPVMDGYTISGTGVPFDPYTGTFTGVATGGGLDIYARVLIIDTYSDLLSAEVIVAEPDPPMIPGDIMGDTPGSPPDGDVDKFDLGEFADAYNSHTGDPTWNSRADFTGDTDGSPPDGDVDKFDLGIFADNYGKSL